MGGGGGGGRLFFGFQNHYKYNNKTKEECQQIVTKYIFFYTITITKTIKDLK